MSVVLVGAVETSLRALEVMLARGEPPALVVTLPPELASRHSDFADLTTPASAAGSAVLHTRQINDAETLDAIRAHAPDAILVVGWSQLCKHPFREIAGYGCFGYHPAALPRLRGRAPIPWTILSGETESAATLFWLGDGADDGEIAVQHRFAVDPAQETARSLYDKHLDALEEALPLLLDGIAGRAVPRIVQDESAATFGAKRTPEDGLIDWRDDAMSIERLIRAVGPPYPGALTRLGDEPIVLLEARPVENSERFVGMTGQVQARGDAGFIVRCGDGGCLEITAWAGREAPPPLHARLR